MASKLYVGNLPFSTTEDSLNELFATVGEVVSVAVITDKYSGRSKGFGFVEMADDKAAQEAIKKLDGHELEGRPLRVSEARPKPE
jgi:RNA recognition motif-containing protein